MNLLPQVLIKTEIRRCIQQALPQVPINNAVEVQSFAEKFKCMWLMWKLAVDTLSTHSD